MIHYTHKGDCGAAREICQVKLADCEESALAICQDCQREMCESCATGDGKRCWDCWDALVARCNQFVKECRNARVA